jgi:gamma-glutamyltranspeptidase / glutathione hydrolase / leukotriene-C4 hydrolase
MTSREYIDAIRSQIDDARTYADFAHYGAYTENKEDHGTAHISVLAPNGDAIAVTSTINYV